MFLDFSFCFVFMICFLFFFVCVFVCFVCFVCSVFFLSPDPMQIEGFPVVGHIPNSVPLDGASSSSSPLGRVAGGARMVCRHCRFWHSARRPSTHAVSRRHVGKTTDENVGHRVRCLFASSLVGGTPLVQHRFVQKNVCFCSVFVKFFLCFCVVLCFCVLCVVLCVVLVCFLCVSGCYAQLELYLSLKLEQGVTNLDRLIARGRGHAAPPFRGQHMLSDSSADHRTTSTCMATVDSFLHGLIGIGEDTSPRDPIELRPPWKTDTTKQQRTHALGQSTGHQHTTSNVWHGKEGSHGACALGR